MKRRCLKWAGIEVIIVTLVYNTQGEGECIHLLYDVVHCEMTMCGNATLDFGMQKAK